MVRACPGRKEVVDSEHFFSTVEPRYNDPRYNDIPQQTQVLILCQIVLYRMMTLSLKVVVLQQLDF